MTPVVKMVRRRVKHIEEKWFAQNSIIWGDRFYWTEGYLWRSDKVSDATVRTWRNISVSFAEKYMYGQPVARKKKLTTSDSRNTIRYIIKFVGISILMVFWFKAYFASTHNFLQDGHVRVYWTDDQRRIQVQTTLAIAQHCSQIRDRFIIITAEETWVHYFEAPQVQRRVLIAYSFHVV